MRKDSETSWPEISGELEARKSKPGKLLVVDDFSYDREEIAFELRQRGHQVAAFETSESALQALKREPFDLVILDHVLPGMDGLELLKAIRAKRTAVELPVIMVTGTEDPETVVAALNLGANDYVTKPIEGEVVSARVANQLSALRLRRSERQLLKEREEFLAFATHDLRGPLTPILGLSALLADSLGPGDRLDADDCDSLRRISKSALAMQGIINDFLEFHALESGRASLNRQPANLADLARETVENCAASAKAKNIDLKLEADPGAPPVGVDPRKIARVMENFLSNAIKYTRPGGEVVVSVRESPDAEGGGGVEFSICDNGPGLTEHDLARAFVRRGSLSNKPTGGEKSFGLGLVICRRLIGLHGGEVGARNNANGVGACFWFRVAADAPGESG